jgi:hypothetical protein
MAITHLIGDLAVIKATLNAAGASLTYQQVETLLNIDTKLLRRVAQRLYDLEHAEGTYIAASWAVITWGSGKPWLWSTRPMSEEVL